MRAMVRTVEPGPASSARVVLPHEVEMTTDLHGAPCVREVIADDGLAGVTAWIDEANPGLVTVEQA